MTQPSGPFHAPPPAPSRRASSVAFLQSHGELILRERWAVAESFGLEMANRYTIALPDGERLEVAERQGGFWTSVGRQLGGHTCNAFVVDVFDARGRVVLTLHHPARYLQQEVTVRTGSGRLLGTINQGLTLFQKKLSTTNAQGRTVFTMEAGMFSWEMPVLAAGVGPRSLAAQISRAWDGAGRVLLSDAGTYRVRFASWLDADARAMIVATALFVDLVFFERRAGR
jgi:uncharacterized protein YxjI